MAVTDSFGYGCLDYWLVGVRHYSVDNSIETWGVSDVSGRVWVTSSGYLTGVVSVSSPVVVSFDWTEVSRSTEGSGLSVIFEVESLVSTWCVTEVCVCAADK